MYTEMFALHHCAPEGCPRAAPAWEADRMPWGMRWQSGRGNWMWVKVRVKAGVSV